MRFKLSRLGVALAATALLLAGPTGAQQELAIEADAALEEKVGLLPEVEINRDAVELQRRLHPVPTDPDIVDTALVFNAPGQRAIVRCVGYGANGRPVGRILLRVPRHGLRFALASDLANGRDFIGHVKCRTRGHTAPTAVLLAPGALTDLPVEQRRGGILFPLVSSY